MPNLFRDKRDSRAVSHAMLAFLLGAMAAALILLDAVWVYAKNFDVDVHSYAVIALLLSPLVFGAVVYGWLRPDPLISATCTATAFLLAFSPSCALLSYLLSTVAGTRIDGLLAHVDHAMGFNWVSVMVFAADHKIITALLGFCYLSVMPQIMLLLLILGGSRRFADLYGLCFAISLGALICVSIWAIHPSFGAFSVFDLPHSAASKLGLALDGNYGRDLVALLKKGPGFISPRELRGVVGFPSFHTVQALVLIWYARNMPAIRWVVLALNFLVLIATPIQGGHHLIDIFGGVAVAVIAIVLSDWIVRTANNRQATATVYDGAALGLETQA